MRLRQFLPFACFITILVLANSGTAIAFQAATSAAGSYAASGLRIICFAHHPDDAEYKSGGTAALWAASGHHVKMVSVTNGDIGHWNMAGGPLANRRTAESTEVARRLGIEYEVLDIHDGELEPTLENRRLITRLIRRWNADIVIAHRPWDYHPDHRYVGVLVQDAAYMVAVPFSVPTLHRSKRTPCSSTAATDSRSPILSEQTLRLPSMTSSTKKWKLCWLWNHKPSKVAHLAPKNLLRQLLPPRNPNFEKDGSANAGIDASPLKPATTDSP
ncbi:MAG UNVERIFIED_CONTAM: PIG-L family deacetylase [Planctomycetaceae bacterium]|jgi:LmbE family N-acetylglucosaminyl deacetylase